MVRLLPVVWLLPVLRPPRQHPQQPRHPLACCKARRYQTPCPVQSPPRLCCQHNLIIRHQRLHLGDAAGSQGRQVSGLPAAGAGGGMRGGAGNAPAGVDVGSGAHSIAAYAEAMQVPNVLPPILLDVSQGWETWGGTQPATLDLLVSINMMHIAELRCTEVSRAGLEPRQPSPGPCPLVWGSQGQGGDSRGVVTSPLTRSPPLSFPRACLRVLGCC